MVGVVARLAERDEVARRVPAGLAGFDVMNIQHTVLRLSVAALALMVVSEEDVFPQVPESHLLAFLVFGTGDVGVLDFLHVELRGLDDDPCYGKYLRHVFEQFDVRLDLLPYGRREPACGLPAVVEARLAVARLSRAAVVAGLPARGELLWDVGAQVDLRGVVLAFLRGYGDSDVLRTGVQASGQRLDVARAVVCQANGERCAPHHRRHAVVEHPTHLAGAFRRHQGFSVFVQYVDVHAFCFFLFVKQLFCCKSDIAVRSASLADVERGFG